VSVIFSEGEMDEVLKKHAGRLVVLFGGVTWCRPCKGVQKPYERLADHYDKAVFLKLVGGGGAFFGRGCLFWRGGSGREHRWPGR
jgi:hypothetical protein